MAAVTSLALTKSSSATTEISGAPGTTVSIVISRVATGEVLPTASVARTDSVSAPSPIAAKSAVVSV